MPSEQNSGILIYAQQTRDGFIHPVFFELVSKAHELSEKLGGVEINAILFSNPEKMGGLKESFHNIGITKVYSFDDNRLKNYSTEYYSKLIVDLVHEITPEILLIGATNEGRDLAPRVSSKLHTGLTADCTELEINDKGLLAATRPTFGGQLMATILCKKYPQMATVRPNVFRVKPANYDINTQFIMCPTNLDNTENRVEILNFKKTVDNYINDLDCAEIIVAGGMGLKNEAGFSLLRDFAKKIGATVAATRSAVEAGLASRSIQVGQTGKTVHPKLYIACGISGAIQHTVGMENSSHIIAINNDKNAPIFDIADTGIVADFFEVAKEFLADN